MQRATRDATGRRRGVPDDSIGRRRGVPDDSIGRRRGVPDDSIGRRRGVPDDSIGRRRGVPDDSIGVLPEDDAQASNLRTSGEADAARSRRLADYARLETPKSPSRPSTGLASALDSHRATVQGALPAADARRLLAAAERSSEVAARLDALLSGMRGAEPRTLTLALQAFARAPGGERGALVSSIAACTGGLPTLEDRHALATVLGTLDDESLRLLGALSERAPSSLAAPSADGRSLVAQLARMSSEPLDPRLSAPGLRAKLLAGALRDVVNPSRVEQGEAPTCTVTSMQFELVSDSPAEYLRLLADLTSARGAAKMRGGGELVLDPSDADAAARHQRSLSQALFQSAAMEYANGTRREFDPVAGRSTHASGRTQAGLRPAQQRRILEALFDVDYRSEYFYWKAGGARALSALEGFDATRHPNRPIILELDEGESNHAVVLESVRDGRVTYRDPVGELLSFPTSDFPTRAMAMHVPRDVGLPKTGILNQLLELF